MEEKRLYNRFDPEIEISGYFELEKEVSGHFRNLEEFIIKDISVGGFNLLSSFSPAIGQRYSIYVKYGKEKHEFVIRVVYSRIHKFLENNEGVFRSGPVFSIGCEIDYNSNTQKDLVVHIIKNDCKFPEIPNPS